MLRLRRLITSICLVLTGLLSLVSLPESMLAAEPVDFTGITPARVALGSDYAYEVQGYDWDFSDIQHYAAEFTRPTFSDGGSLSGGLFVGTTGSDPKIWLQDLTIPGTIPASNEGGYPHRAIDTSRYRYLTFRMFSSVNGLALVYWHRDRGFAVGSFGGAGFKQVKAGWNTYVFDLVNDRNVGAGSLAWNAGPIEGINIKPVFVAGATIKIDYARLSATPPSTAPVVTAEWTPTAGTFDLYFDTNPNGANATLIQSGVAASAGSFGWRTPNLAPGTYYLIAKRGADQSASPAFVVNTPPHISILAPSYTSGPDYATTVVGDPWDMSNPEDIDRQFNVVGGSFDNGVFTGANSNGNGDPGLHLHVTSPIDPARFYYATYRMQLRGPQDILLGSVLRLLWWTGINVANTASTTKDVVIYENWRTVSIDLRGALLEPSSKGNWLSTPKVGFRLDPHEFQIAHTFDLDYVRLTGNDRASDEFTIHYDVDDADNDMPTVAFFYDSDRAGANGTRITCVTSGPPSGGPNKIYLPLITVSGSGVGGMGCTWDLSNVANGDYYVYAVANDGTDSIVVYSDTPLEVRK
jgi:hypothetical protein